MGIEPTSVAWEATALPLSYARVAWGEFRRVRASGAMCVWQIVRLPGPPQHHRHQDRTAVAVCSQARHTESTYDEGRLPGPRVLRVLRDLQCVDQKLPLKFTNKVASRALRWAVVVLRPTLLCRPHRPVRAPSTTVA